MLPNGRRRLTCPEERKLGCRTRRACGWPWNDAKGQVPVCALRLGIYVGFVASFSRQWAAKNWCAQNTIIYIHVHKPGITSQQAPLSDEHKKAHWTTCFQQTSRKCRLVAPMANIGQTTYGSHEEPSPQRTGIGELMLLQAQQNAPVRFDKPLFANIPGTKS